MDRLSLQPDGAFVQAMFSHNERENRRFARAIGADQAETFTFLHIRRKLVRRSQPAKSFHKAVECQNGHFITPARSFAPIA